MTTSTENSPPAAASVMMVNIDCPDAGAMAAFWSQMLDGKIEHDEADYSMVVADGLSLGFGRIDDYAQPAWPDDGHKQFHLDVAVGDLGEAADCAVGFGARRADPQPDGSDGRWVVMLDPAGHPFCLCRAG